jgi:hypothetical protein
VSRGQRDVYVCAFLNVLCAALDKNKWDTSASVYANDFDLFVEIATKTNKMPNDSWAVVRRKWGQYDVLSLGRSIELYYIVTGYFEFQTFENYCSKSKLLS